MCIILVVVIHILVAHTINYFANDDGTSGNFLKLLSCKTTNILHNSPILLTPSVLWLPHVLCQEKYQS